MKKKKHTRMIVENIDIIALVVSIVVLAIVLATGCRATQKKEYNDGCNKVTCVGKYCESTLMYCE